MQDGKQHPKRRRYDFLDGEFSEHPALTERMERIEAKQAEQLDAVMGIKGDTNQLLAETTELLEMLRAAKGAWQVLEFVGKLAKPVGAVVALAAAVVTFWSSLKK